jgi:DNA-binding transcriptional ArsR family regulator
MARNTEVDRAQETFLMSYTHLTWESGTAYDFFISLKVLHDPGRYGLRGAWAAGVRSRLPAPARDFLQELLPGLIWPFHWLRTLPTPQDSAAVLCALEAMPAAARLPALTLAPFVPDAWAPILHAVAARGRWDEADEMALLASYKAKNPEAKQTTVKNRVSVTLRMWAEPERFNTLLPQALQAYRDVFFLEEEARIRPALSTAVAHARALAQDLTVLELLETLSQGVRFSKTTPAVNLVLAPSFWVTPLVLVTPLGADTDIFIYGARPANVSLVPGEAVPDALFHALKALADPTRLRILHYLSAEPLTPAELARRLRLRAPTVIHHLDALRIARLVQLTLTPEGPRYQARHEAIYAAWEQLERFLNASNGR